MAHRTMRPHLGNDRHTVNFHPPELSITDWAFTYWQPFKQMQWMMLSPAAIDFFRTDRLALNYLALMEHSYMPEESFFATGTFLLTSFVQYSPVHEYHHRSRQEALCSR